MGPGRRGHCRAESECSMRIREEEQPTDGGNAEVELRHVNERLRRMEARSSDETTDEEECEKQSQFGEEAGEEKSHHIGMVSSSLKCCNDARRDGAV